MSGRQEPIPNIIHAISGATGGVLSMILTYPLVTISTHAQTEAQRKTEHEESEESQKETRPKSMLETFEHIWADQGLKGLYSGLESALFGIALTNFIYYYFYELNKKIVMRGNKLNKNISTLQSMAIGCIAGCITVVLTNPIWVANTRATVLHKEHKELNTFQILLQILKDPQGFRQLFNGVLPALMLVSNPIIQYSFFEQCKNLISKRKRKLTAFDAFYLGALGKLLATGSTYPYITLKSRMHLHKDHKSMWALTKEIFQKEGINGFYNGISVKLTQSILTAAFLFYFKEELVTANFKIYKFLQGRRR